MRFSPSSLTRWLAHSLSDCLRGRSAAALAAGLAFGAAAPAAAQDWPGAGQTVRQPIAMRPAGPAHAGYPCASCPPANYELHTPDSSLAARIREGLEGKRFASGVYGRLEYLNVNLNADRTVFGDPSTRIDPITTLGVRTSPQVGAPLLPFADEVGAFFSPNSTVTSLRNLTANEGNPGNEGPLLSTFAGVDADLVVAPFDTRPAFGESTDIRTPILISNPFDLNIDTDADGNFDEPFFAQLRTPTGDFNTGIGNGIRGTLGAPFKYGAVEASVWGVADQSDSRTIFGGFVRGDNSGATVDVLGSTPGIAPVTVARTAPLISIPAGPPQIVTLPISDELAVNSARLIYGIPVRFTDDFPGSVGIPSGDDANDFFPAIAAIDLANGEAVVPVLDPNNTVTDPVTMEDVPQPVPVVTTTDTTRDGLLFFDGPVVTTYNVELNGADAQALINIAPQDRFLLQGIVGFRYVNLEEMLGASFSSSSALLGGVTNGFIRTDTSNEIYAPTVGFKSELNLGWLSLGVVPRLGLGANRQSVAVTSGGLRNNSPTATFEISDTDLAIAFDVSAYGTVRLREWLSVNVGYQWNYLDRVQRPGQAVDYTVDSRSPNVRAQDGTSSLDWGQIFVGMEVVLP